MRVKAKLGRIKCLSVATVTVLVVIFMYALRDVKIKDNVNINESKQSIKAERTLQEWSDGADTVQSTSVRDRKIIDIISEPGELSNIKKDHKHKVLNDGKDEVNEKDMENHMIAKTGVQSHTKTNNQSSNGVVFQKIPKQAEPAINNTKLVIQARTDNDQTAKKSVVTKKVEIVEMKSVFVNPVLHVNTTGEFSEKHSILMWNPPGWMANWYGDVDLNQCSYKNCKMIFNKEKFESSSAVMFSVGDSGMGRNPPVSLNNRNPDQAWMFFTLESPVHLGFPDFRSSTWHNAMNWSWNYRADSDIFHSYGILQTRLEPPKKNYTDIFRRKTKMAAWAVSHCSTQSKREQYVKNMNNYTTVDIYGKCGSSYPADFKQILNRDYKFYLGFENSMCPDYVTEKLFNYYKSDIVTVVRGNTDYKKYLPEGTYINAADFSSIKDLVDFMKKLGSDEEEYIKYLKRKDMYTVKERDFMFREALCSVCHKLNNLDKYRKSYPDIVKWMGTCVEPNDLR